MSDEKHPSVERISEASAGALSPAEAMSVNAHLSGCDSCAGIRDALDDVSAVLRVEGDDVPPVPDNVASALDAAVAAEVAQRRRRRAEADPQPTVSARSPSRVALRWLGGAAAAVLVVGIGVAGLRALPTQSSGDNSAAGGSTAPSPEHQPSKYGGDVQGEGGSAEVDGTKEFGQLTPQAVRRAVQREATRLAAKAPGAPEASSSGCAKPAGGGIVHVLNIGHRRYVIQVHPDNNQAVLYECQSANYPLIVTHF